MAITVLHGKQAYKAVEMVEGKKSFYISNADIVAFGRSFLANPDFVTPIEDGASLNQLDFTTLYTPGEKGYTDYPALN